MISPSQVLMMLAMLAGGVLVVALWQASMGGTRSESSLAGAVVVSSILLLTVPPTLSLWQQGPGWPSYAVPWTPTADRAQKYLGYVLLALIALALIGFMGELGGRRKLGALGTILLGWQGLWLFSTVSQGQQLSLFLLLLPGVTVVLHKSRLDRRTVLSLVMSGAFAVCGLSLVLGFVSPARFVVPPNRTFGAVFPGRLVGLVDDPNLLGAVASVLIVAAIYRWRRARRLAAIFVGVTTIAFCDSRSALVACAAAIGAGMLRWLLARRTGTERVPASVAIVLAAGAAGVGFLLHGYLGSQEDLSTLDGRRQVWDTLVSAVSGSRLVGMGAAAFASLQTNGVVGSSIGSGHNSWIDAYVHTGILGVMLLTALQLVLGVKAFRAVHVDRGLSFALFVLLMVRSVSEPQMTIGYLNWNSLITLLLVLLVSRGPRQRPTTRGSHPESERLDSGASLADAPWRQLAGSEAGTP